MNTQTEVKHTATPWTIKGYEIVNKDGWIASFNQDKPEDAAYAVRAVNCHEELIKAANTFLESIGYVCEIEDQRTTFIKAIAKAEAL